MIAKDNKVETIASDNIDANNDDDNTSSVIYNYDIDINGIHKDEWQYWQCWNYLNPNK